jgi:antirestriction protein ArdC
MKKTVSASEALAHKYADIFVALFNRIPSNPQDPFLTPSAFPQQNMSGHVYSGRNGFVTSLVASSNGYEFPVWLTFNQIKSAGLSLRAGERSVPIAVYRYVLYEKETGKKSDITEDDYRLMSPDEKSKYEVKCFLKPPWHVFNLSQTNFKEAMPEQYAELLSRLQGPQARSISEALVDDVVTKDNWQCPIRINSNVIQPSYTIEKDIIISPPKEAFIDNAAYYSSILYMMSESSCHPDRSERNLPDSLRRLSSQLSSAMLCSFLGITSRIDHDNLSHLKQWSLEISKEPMVIYKSINDASRSADIVGRHLGIGVKKGVDISGIFKEADEALSEANEQKKDKGKHKFSAKLKR